MWGCFYKVCIVAMKLSKLLCSAKSFLIWIELNELGWVTWFECVVSVAYDIEVVVAYNIEVVFNGCCDAASNNWVKNPAVVIMQSAPVKAEMHPPPLFPEIHVLCHRQRKWMQVRSHKMDFATDFRRFSQNLAEWGTGGDFKSRFAQTFASLLANPLSTVQ